MYEVTDFSPFDTYHNPPNRILLENYGMVLHLVNECLFGNGFGGYSEQTKKCKAVSVSSVQKQKNSNF